ncbi:stretch-activated Ca2+-permeable channel component-domain-containing protein [Epithele typhae]|uniref:stretch-activated Ca2+-permeable channel component-domain-containing protein n=1 Tax=Epithele typhae TaxID=378194 RepID=UPI002008E9A2|nr:stretch-activated Ca2+-permeable channel component-domain-containing protein [Epithele typhae]KAH9939715.1 stretch-activated Ca2+-permeable channel component-domain-containing protein [Epithele typhae]
MLLPVSLFALVQSFVLLAEAQQQQLALDTVRDFNSSSLPSPPTFFISPSSDFRHVSVGLCASSAGAPRFFVSNDSSITHPGPDNVDGKSVIEISVGPEGYGSFAGFFPRGGFFAIQAGSVNTPFEILLSAANSTNPLSPFASETTANQAIVFSPSFDPLDPLEPSYPNYTLPSANLTQGNAPSPPKNYTLVYVPTANSPLASVLRTNCAIRSAAQQSNSGAKILSSNSATLWLRDDQGWRWEWFLGGSEGGLTPKTNYTMYTLQDGTIAASKPVMFLTKSASFACALVHQLPYCPAVAYAVPLAVPRPPQVAYTASTLPSPVGETIVSGMSNFTSTLTTLACGRDDYSPLVTCADCQAAYRTWLCTVSFPRCGESNPTSPTPPGASPSTALLGGSSAQQVLLPAVPALKTVNASAAARNPALPAFGEAYEVLLPCLEVCNAADRACPVFLGFKCPLPAFTASDSYAVGYVDSGREGEVGGGATGGAWDEFGNVWCNGP